MTADEYWDGDNRLPRAYLKAHKLIEERENRYEHRLGAYIYSALCEVSPLFRFSTKRVKVEPYLREPFPITQEEVDAREYKEKKARHDKFISRLSGTKGVKFEN